MNGNRWLIWKPQRTYYGNGPYINPFTKKVRNLWQDIKVYFNDNINSIINRPMLIDGLDWHGETVDTYRNYLTQAGYLEIVSRGRYEVLKEIPIDLTLNDVKNEAYNKFKEEFITEEEFSV